jgi:uncharacterized phage protein gp47/JayE
MPTIDDSGVTPTTLEEYGILFASVFQSVFGLNFSVDPETPQGQVIGLTAFGLSQADDAFVNSAQSLDIYKASGNQLDGIMGALGVYRKLQTRTTVPVELTGVPATLIPATSRARDTNGELFTLNTDIQLDGSGNGAGTMTAINYGAIVVGVGTLTQVVDTVPGWETVNNATAGTEGQDTQIDSQARNDYFVELFRNAVSPFDAVKAAVSEAENVIEVGGAENDQDTPDTFDGVVVGAHTIAIVVDGGVAEDIGAAIRLKKTAGTATQGTTAWADPPNTDINFYYADDLFVTINVNITIGTGFPGNGTALMQQRIDNYLSGVFAGSIDDDYFETDGMKISEDLNSFRIYTPVNSVPGHVVNSITLEKKSGGGPVTVVTATLIDKIKVETISDISITVV